MEGKARQGMVRQGKVKQSKALKDWVHSGYSVILKWCFRNLTWDLTTKLCM